MTNSERELLKAWLEAAGADGQDIEYRAREHKKFLRVLNEVKAEAWDEAIDEAMGQGTIQVPPNPYDEDEGT